MNNMVFTCEQVFHDRHSAYTTCGILVYACAYLTTRLDMYLGFFFVGDEKSLSKGFVFVYSCTFLHMFV